MRTHSVALYVVIASLFLAVDLVAQIPMSTSYSQEFNGMGTNGLGLPTNWRVNNSPSGYRTADSWNDSDPDVDDDVNAYPLAPHGSDYSFNCGAISNSADRAVVIRPRQSAYSGTFVAWFRNDGAQTVVTVSLSYDIEKYRADVNPTGSEIAVFYTYSATADFPTANGGTNPSTSWVKVTVNGVPPSPATGTTVVPTRFDADPNTNGNGGPTIPFYAITIPSFDITGLSVPPNGNFYLAFCFSPGDPTNQGGNNAQDAQAYGLDNFNFSSSSVPVELTSLSGAYRNGKIDLKWKTATESNNFGFDIERSVDNGSSWKTVGFIRGHGTVNTPSEYSFTDAANFRGLRSVSYRLRQVDRDGSFEYSKILSVSLSAVSRIQLRNYPNPFNPSTNISFDLPEADVVSLRILDDAGREIATLLNGSALDAGTHNVPFFAAGLASGSYHYELETSSEVFTNQMLLTK